MKTKLYHFTLTQALLLLTSLLAISGALVYKLYSLNWLGVIFSLGLTALASSLIARYSHFSLPKLQLKPTDLWPESSYLALWLANLIILIQSRSHEAISTPWQVISPWFFVCFGALSLQLLWLSLKARPHWPVYVSLYLILSYVLAVIIYGLGYGFDPFIHQATLKFIDQFGAVSPKPFYYSGQYALEIIIHKLTNFPLDWLDKLLVPISAALLLPTLAWQHFRQIFDRGAAARLSLVLISASLTSFFIITTPQNLAYLLLTALVIVTMSNRQNWLLNYSLAFAALVTQPIAGIPALLAVGCLQLYTSQLDQRRLLVGAGLTLSAILLPLSFFFIDKSYNLASNLSFNNFNLTWLQPSLANASQPWLNFANTLLGLLPLSIIVLTTAGFWLNRRKQTNHTNHYAFYLWQGLALIIAYLLTKTIGFNFLIDYERDNYANRMLACAIIFWLPLISISLYEFIKLILTEKNKTQLTWALVAAGLLTANLYISYPRQDAYLNSHSYASSIHDLEAVNWINIDAAGKDYIVLANQQVSAASLRQFGFAKYYANNVFYYPIPTGGPLYQYYLSLVKTPDLNTIKSAGSLVGVNQVYVVINEYWWQARRLITELDLLADSHQKIAGGKVHVFKFTW